MEADSEMPDHVDNLAEIRVAVALRDVVGFGKEHQVDVLEASGMSPGSFYPKMRELEGRGWVGRKPDPERPRKGDMVRVTETGAQAIRLIEEWVSA